MSHNIADYIGALWFVCLGCSFIAIIVDSAFDVDRLYKLGIRGLCGCATFLIIWLMIAVVILAIKG